MSELSVRRASAADLPAIVDLLADDPIGRTRERPGLPLDRRYVEAFAAIDRDPNQLLAVVDATRGESAGEAANREAGGRVVGCLQLTFIPGLTRLGLWRGQIEGVRIAEGYRDRGLGRMMMAWAVAECRRRGCGLVQLTTDKARPDAHRFYEALGFAATHEGMKLTIRADAS